MKHRLLNCGVVFVLMLAVGCQPKAELERLREEDRAAARAADVATADTQKMVGLLLKDLIVKHRLQNALVWDAPNLPPGSDSRRMYFLDDGNLEVHFNADEKITSATFEKKAGPAQERLDAVYKAWTDHVDSKKSP